MQKIAIIIPCYNEEKRIIISAFSDLLNSTSAMLYLANDGSNDNTLAILEHFAEENPNRCRVINYSKNAGKAHTIYKAVNYIMATRDYDYISYFDADFSTPPNEIERLLAEVENTDVKFVLGSRVLLLNSGIKRKLHRHVIGRIIITLINLKFKLGIYDTQCGAKIISTDIIHQVFNTPFRTSWLFDVEIFIRLKHLGLLKTGREVPIYGWQDIDGSKLGFRTGFKILKELYLLIKHY